MDLESGHTEYVRKRSNVRKVSQKEKNKYQLLVHVCRVQKNGADEPIFRAGIEMQMQSTNVWTQCIIGGRIERFGLTCIHYDVQNRQLVGSCCLAQGAQLRLCDDLEGRDGGRKEVQTWEGKYTYN